MLYFSNERTVYADLDDATQYATVYDVKTDKPLATLMRARVIGWKAGDPRWELYLLDGERIRVWKLPRSYQGLVIDAAYAISSRKAGNR